MGLSNRVTSTAADGVAKHFGYDGNGNATAVISSAGGDLAGLSFAGALGQASQENVNATYSVYSKRGVVKQVVEEGRRLSSGGALVDLVTGRVDNAFGEITSETDARGFTTDYTYNAAGRMTSKISPQVSVTSESGAVSSIRPTENYAYDISGRLVGTQDANGHTTTRVLLGGTGHDGGEAPSTGSGQGQVTAEYRPDGSVWTTKYDAFGDARLLADGLGRITSQVFDKMGRVTQITRPATAAGTLVESFAYDGLGQRLKAWNNVYGEAGAARTDYDALGRVISQVAAGGDVTTTSYVWNGGLVTSGLGSFGGWVVTTAYANGRTSVMHSDGFGRELWKQDMGGHQFSSSYDVAGRLSSRSGTGGGAYGSQGYSYYNTGQLAGTSGSNGIASYGYDAAGNRLSEYATGTSGQVIKNASASYDALGRMTSWSEAGSTTTPAASTTTAYDANGTSSPAQQTRSFRYDALNRLVYDSGKTLLYDGAGQRVAVIAIESRPGRYHYDPEEGDVYIPGSFWEARENYIYDAAGRLSQVQIARGAAVGEYDGVPAPAAPATGPVRSSFAYDLLGRVTGQTDYDTDATTAIYSRAVSYTVKGQVDVDDVSTLRWRTGTTGIRDLLRARSVHGYGTGSGYALGSAVSIATQNWKNGIDTGSTGAPDTLTTTSYSWWDNAVQASIAHDDDTGSGANPVHATSYSYDGLGSLASIYVGDGRPRTISFSNDASGQAVRRDEADNNGGQGDPHEIWYRFNGREMGMTGNNGSGNVSYEASLAERMSRPPASVGPFRDGSTNARPYSDFAGSYDAINSYAQGASGGGYTVRAGDTLASIAASVWGDAGLWYKLAEANGLSGQSALAEGTTLTVPAGVVRSHHNSNTFTPYDPSAIIGDTLPTTPRPQKGNKCGGLGQVIMIAVAVAVTALTQGGAAGFAASLLGGSTSSFGAVAIGGALAGAAGSVASQAFGVATGIQDKFSFKGVAMAALSGAVGGGLGKLIPAGAVGGSSFITDVVRGALSSATTQGVSVATGLQQRFSWTGVAAAGIGAGVGGAAARGLAGAGIPAGRFGNQAGATMADAIAQAGTRSIIQGTGFGDNLVASLPSALGNLAGRALAGGIATAFDGKSGTIGNRMAADAAAGAGGLGKSHWEGSGFRMRWVSDNPAELGLSLDAHATPTGRAITLYGNGNAKLTAELYANPTDKDLAGMRTQANAVKDETIRQQLLDRLDAFNLRAWNERRLASPSPVAVTEEPSLFGSVVAQLGDMPLPALGGRSLSQFRADADTFSTSAQNFLNTSLASVEKNAAYLPPQQRLSTIAGANFLHTAASGFAQLPQMVTHPVRTGQSAAYGAAGLVDGVRIVNDTPARISVPNAISYLANNPDDIARFGGKLGGALLPVKFKGGLKFEAAANAGVEAAFAQRSMIHKNSLNYVGDTHVYAILKGDGSIWKFGESTQGVGRDGLSVRGEAQARVLRQETGEFHRSSILDNFPNKAPARSHETQLILEYIEKYGHRPPGNKVNR